MHNSQDTAGDLQSVRLDASSRAAGRGWWLVPAVLVVVHLLVAVPLILSGTMTGRWGEDQINYHEPAVRLFAQELPTPNVRDYHSATTPGYHLMIAAASRVLGDSTSRLQLIGSCFTAALLACFGAVVSQRFRERAALESDTGDTQRRARSFVGPLTALAVCTPLLCSMYVFQAGVWLLPDNAGWLGVLAVMVVALRFRVSISTLAAGSAALVMLVLFRQIHIWAAGLLWVAAWLSVQGIREPPESVMELVTYPKLRLRRAVVAFIATLPAFVVLYLFYNLWGGLTPREFQGQYRGFNLAAPAFILAVLGVVSLFFLGFIADGLRLLVTRKRWLLAASVVVGVLVGVVPETSYSVVDGRFSGLWKIAEKLPLLAGRTAPGIVALAVLGSVMAAAWFVSLPWRERWLFLAALCGFAAAQSASFQIWQRYNEPFVLMLLALLSSSVPAVGSDREARSAHGALQGTAVMRLLRVVGPGTLAAGFVLLTYLTMRGAPRANLFENSVLPPSPHAAPAP